MAAFTLDFSKKITICATSEEELAKRYKEMVQAHVEAGRQFVECKLYVAVLVPVTKDALLESRHNSLFGLFRNQITRFLSKFRSKLVTTAVNT